MALPTGPIQSATPYRNSPRFGCNWNKLQNRYQFHEAAHQAFPRVPIALGVSVEIIESCMTTGLTSRDDGFGDGPALGSMQTKRHWFYLVDDFTESDVMTTAGGILMGYAVLDNLIGQTGSWQGAIRKYHPGTDPHSGANPDTYVRSSGDLQAEFNAAVGQQPETGTYNWTDPGWPASMEYGIVTKSWVGAGFDRVAFRGPGMIGTADHITAGGGDPDFIRRFFSIGGERHNDALTDTVIGRDGSGLVLNDPWDEANGGTRAGWANGGSNGLEGDGIEFVRKLGVAAINGRLLSKEHIARSGESLTDAQVETSIAVSVMAHQRARTKWDLFPYNDVAGCYTAMTHDEFSTKDGEWGCPGGVFKRDHLPVIWQEVKGGLKLLQTGTGGPVSPVDPPPPVDPLILPFDLEWPEVKWLFGTLTRKMPDGTVKGYPADPKGIITNAWIGRAAKDGVFPRADIWEVVNGKNFVQFLNGWTLYTPKIDDFVNWRWVDATDLDAERAVAA